MAEEGDPELNFSERLFDKRKGPVAYHDMIEKMTREQAVGNARKRAIGKQLKDCIHTNGVNQFVECRELREKYWTFCVDDRFTGALFPEGLQPPTRRHPMVSGPGKPK
jgi:hypothetical protein